MLFRNAASQYLSVLSWGPPSRCFETTTKTGFVCAVTANRMRSKSSLWTDLVLLPMSIVTALRRSLPLRRLKRATLYKCCVRDRQTKMMLSSRPSMETIWCIYEKCANFFVVTVSIKTKSVRNMMTTIQKVAELPRSIRRLARLKKWNSSHHASQSIRINCRSDCYYDKYTSPSQYEETYKERMRENLAAASRWCHARGRTNETRSEKAILSCTVLAANSAILRRHNVDNKLCPYCDNDDQKHLQVVETDQFGFITRMLCAKCGRHLPTVCRRSRFYYEEIDESTFLKRGDHICWHRNLGSWHHAIVTSNHMPTVTIAEYGPYGRNVTFKETIKGGPDFIPSCLSGTPYRITYDDCYSNEYTALRAEKCIGEHHYNIFHRNCEHSSHWCKTGLNKSDQVVT